MLEVKFFERQKEVFRLFGNKDYSEVERLINEVKVQFPNRLEKTLFWQACVSSLQGELDKAIAALNEGLAKGVWWNPHTLLGDPDLKNLHNLEAFQSIVQVCEELLERYNQETVCKLFTYGNQETDTGIFSLHWRGSNVKDFAPFWFDNETLNKYFFGFPQSSQVYGYNAYKWDNPDYALRDITNTFDEFKGKWSSKNIILAGASQGGALAIELSLNKNMLGTKGFIAVTPAIQDVSRFEKQIKEIPAPKIKSCIITGNQDPFYERTVELKSIFEAHGLPCKFIVKEGLGHFFPEDFPNILQDAVDYILH